MKKVLHSITHIPKPQDVSNEHETRCGLKGLPLGMGLYDQGALRFEGTTDESRVTCSKCKLKLTSNQKKILRVALDYGRNQPFILGFKRSFGFRSDGNLIVQGPNAKKLIDENLLRNVDGGRLFRLTARGITLATTLPKVKEDF